MHLLSSLDVLPPAHFYVRQPQAVQLGSNTACNAGRAGALVFGTICNNRMPGRHCTLQGGRCSAQSASHAHRRKSSRDVKPCQVSEKRKSQICNSSLRLLQVDLQTDQLVATLVWPLERYGCIAELQQLGDDALVRHCFVLHACQQTKSPATSHMVRTTYTCHTHHHPSLRPPATICIASTLFCCLQDQLRRLAVKQGSLMIGTRYWAKQALTAVLSHLQANSMKQILQHPQATQNMPETGALMVVS